MHPVHPILPAPPWTNVIRGYERDIVFTDAGQVSRLIVATVRLADNQTGNGSERQEAKFALARAVAALPEMIAALLVADGQLAHHCDIDHPVRRQIRDAYRKALGENHA